jgi:predicted DNA-binding WGR domain protein
VSITTENRIHGTGLELTGRVTVAEDKREYRPQLLITEDGGVSKAECTCSLFRKQGLQHGPCPHLIALRLAYALREKERLASGKSRAAITVETRTYSRRDHSGEDVYQISLDRHKLRLRWGKAGGEMRSQNFRFNSTEEARTEYLSRLESLVSKGYLDASGG